MKDRIGTSPNTQRVALQSLLEYAQRFKREKDLLNLVLVRTRQQSEAEQKIDQQFSEEKGAQHKRKVVPYDSLRSS